MRMVSLTILAGCLAAQLSAATIGFLVSNLGGNSFRYTYSITGMFQANQELDILFDPTLYGTLSNGKPLPGPDFSLMLFQPNNPPGSFGDYSLTALVNNPSLAGPFSVDFTYLGPVPPGPGSQPFQLFDANFNLIQSGVTMPQGSSGGVPEPGSFSLGAMGLLLGGVWVTRRRIAESS